MLDFRVQHLGHAQADPATGAGLGIPPGAQTGECLTLLAQGGNPALDVFGSLQADRLNRCGHLVQGQQAELLGLPGPAQFLAGHAGAGLDRAVAGEHLARGGLGVFDGLGDDGPQLRHQRLDLFDLAQEAALLMLVEYVEGIALAGDMHHIDHGLGAARGAGGLGIDLAVGIHRRWQVDDVHETTPCVKWASSRASRCVGE